MRPTKSIASACALVLLAATGAVRAQAKGEAHDYTFEADDLIGETLGAPPPLLRVPPKGVRVMFLRPRVSFVVEMLKSVDAL